MGNVSKYSLHGSYMGYKIPTNWWHRVLSHKKTHPKSNPIESLPRFKIFDERGDQPFTGLLTEMAVR